LIENAAPLKRAGQLELIDGDARVAEGVRVQLTGGHTRGHQIVFVESDGETLVHLGDLVPTSHHLPLPYIMGYDTFPLETLAMRKRLYSNAVSARWKLFFGHDFSPKVAGLTKRDGKYLLDDSTLINLKRG
jgi:glyoxylase-like metal-dependent hydrolase (beta-lactamase superfamily II)